MRYAVDTTAKKIIAAKALRTSVGILLVGGKFDQLISWIYLEYVNLY